jgi:hypothetical protein
MGREIIMKPAIALASLAVSVVLSGCVAYGPPPPGPYAYGPYPAEAVAYDGFYDGYYGPFYDGYWARDGYFYYADRNHSFHRDYSGHFRRNAVVGYRHVQSPGRPAGGGRPGGEQHR